MNNHFVMIIHEQFHSAQLFKQLLQLHEIKATTATQVSHALRALKQGTFAVVVYHCAEVNRLSLEACQKLHDYDAALPLMVLCDKASEQDHVKVLNSGAVDVLDSSSPIELLVQKIKLLMTIKQGAAAPASEQFITVGAVKMCEASYETWVGQAALMLTPIEFEILEVLLRNHNKVVSKIQLAELVWGSQEVNSTVIETNIYNLRKKLSENNLPNAIQTRRGLGYMLKEQATIIQD